MKKVIIIISFFCATNVDAQTLSTDSLSTIIRTLQKQVASLMTISYPHYLTFTAGQFFVTNTPDSLHQTISLAVLPLPPVNSQLELKDSTAIVNLTNKIAALKATSTTTTTIQ